MHKVEGSIPKLENSAFLRMSTIEESVPTAKRPLTILKETT